MEYLLTEIRNCSICLPFLKDGVNPILSAHPKSKIAIIGQAPGSIVHRSGVPWEDKSGDRLRSWLGVDKDTFYDEEIFAIIPMGFCYPGKGKSGDLPPRKECAPQWHGLLFEHLQELELILLIGQYAQNYYLNLPSKTTLTEVVKDFRSYTPQYFPLPHPSPRNNIWLKKNGWFEDELIPVLKKTVQTCLG